MQIELLGCLHATEDDEVWLPPVADHHGRVTYGKLEPEDFVGYDDAIPAPHRIHRLSIIGWDEIWIFRGFALRTKPDKGSIIEPLSYEQQQIEIVHAVLKREEHFQRLSGSLSSPDANGRETLPRHVRLFVWQRDQGRCVQCGGRELLEFDHIIPVAKGGSSTERNLQLLCEPCNRQKSDEI